MTERTFSYPKIPIQKFAFFADESSITNARYSLVGGTAIGSFRLLSVYKRMWEFRKEHQMFAELKWSKVSNQKYDAYQDLVEIYFEFLEAGILSFHVTTFDNHMWKHQRYNDSDPDIGLSKNYYQLILHQYISVFGDLASLYVCLDRRLSSTPLEKLQRILNAGAAKDYGLTFGPVRTLESRDSKKDDLLQMNDVILGAVAAVKNERHTDEATRKAKVDLAELVLKKARMTTYDKNTPPQDRGFTVWNRNPR